MAILNDVPTPRASPSGLVTDRLCPGYLIPPAVHNHRICSNSDSVAAIYYYKFMLSLS